MSDGVRRIVEATVAMVPADAEGLLVVRMRNAEWTQDRIDAFSRAMHEAGKAAGLRCRILCVPLFEGQEFSMDLLSDGRLEELGFRRVSTSVSTDNSISDITRSFA